VKSLQNSKNYNIYQHVEAQTGVATGQSVLAWRLGYAEVFSSKAPRPEVLSLSNKPL